MAKGRYYTPGPIRHVPGLTYRKGRITERYDAYEGTPEVLQAAGIAEPNMLPSISSIAWRPEGAHRQPYAAAEGYMTITALPGGRYRVYRTVSAEEQAERQRAEAANNAARDQRLIEWEQSPEAQRQRRLIELAQCAGSADELRKMLNFFTRMMRMYFIESREHGPYRLIPDKELLASLQYAIGVFEDAIEQCPIDVNKTLEAEISAKRKAIAARGDPAFQAMLKGLRRRPARRGEGQT
jgi:hypothetical protein